MDILFLLCILNNLEKPLYQNIFQNGSNSIREAAPPEEPESEPWALPNNPKFDRSAGTSSILVMFVQ